MGSIPLSGFAAPPGDSPSLRHRHEMRKRSRAVRIPALAVGQALPRRARSVWRDCPLALSSPAASPSDLLTETGEYPRLQAAVRKEPEIRGHVLMPVRPAVAARPHMRLRVDLVRIRDVGIVERIARADIHPHRRAIARRMRDQGAVAREVLCIVERARCRVARAEPMKIATQAATARSARRTRLH
jgi:hypothetical protein